MDTKNVIAAISLSAAVIILYSLFFAPTPKEIKKVNNENIKKEQSSDTPLLEENENLPKLSREDALNENKRFNFENENIKGSISLMGGVIDDLILQTLNPNAYKDIDSKLKSSNKQREKYIKIITNALVAELEKYNISPEVFGRPKSRSSIYGKMVQHLRNVTMKF